MRVCSNFAIQLVCFLDERFQLFKTILCRADCISFGEHSARSTSLNYVSAILDLITDGSAYLLYTVSNAIFNSLVHQSGPKAIAVAMTTPNAKSVAGRFHSGPGCPALVYCFAQSHVIKPAGGAHVSDTCKASHQRCARILHTQDRGKRFEVP